MSATPFAFVSILAALTSVALGQEHWSDHRGPRQNYHLTTKTEYPKKWSVATGENILWRVPLPETGHSGIAVWNDRLFLTCFRKLTTEDNGPKGTWVSETRGYCLAADTGKILWSCDLPGERPNQVNGTLPILYVFLARSGKTIRNVEMVALDDKGGLQQQQGAPSPDITGGHSRKVQTYNNWSQP